MAGLAIPSFERRLLRAVSEEVEAEPVHAWPEPSVRICLDLLRKIRENSTTMRHQLEAILAEGVEARSFARNNSQVLPIADDQLAQVRGLVERLVPGKGDVSD